jgi:two-component system, cell cycle sensor histidine kinase and response regulator CckA
MAKRAQHGTGSKVSDLFAAAIEQSPHGVLLEHNGSIVYANRKFLRLTGLKRECLGDLSVRELRKRCKAVFGQELGRQKEQQFECSSYRAEVGGRRIRVHVLRGVAAQRRLERQALESHKMEALGRLVGGVTHDFNNVLTAIRIYADLLAVAEGVKDEGTANRYLEEIRRSAERGTERIRQLLAFARQRPTQPQVVSVDSVLRGMEDTLRRMLGERVVLVMRCNARAGNVCVDPAQLEEVILNVAMNARDAMAERHAEHSGTDGTLSIESSVEKSRRGIKRLAGHATDASAVQIAITDNGCGMDQATRSHLFEPFFTTKGVGKGTGLGLATAYGIVSQSGGTIAVDSDPGRGTTVTILLPRTLAKVETAPPKLAKRVQPGSESVLVIEQDAGVRASLKRSLIGCGYQVDCAPDSVTAIEVARAHTIDAVICDEALAGTRGNELAALCPEVKFVFVSGSGVFCRGKKHAPGKKYVFINKPFDLADLTQKLRQVLGSDPHSAHRAPDGVAVASLPAGHQSAEVVRFGRTGGK